MEKNKKSKQHNLLIALWMIPFLIIELLLIFNLIFKVTKENVFDFIFSIILVGIIFLPGIIISFINKKHNNPKKNIWNFLFQAGFVFIAFVGLVEASFDSDLTTKQVKQFLSFVQGESSKTIYMESFEIEIVNEKEKYEIDDVINFKINYKPFNATQTSPLYKIDNDIVKVDIYNKTITCLANGTVNIHFYTSHDKNISYDVTVVIESLTVKSIKFNEESKDIFLTNGQQYQLQKPIISPSALSGEKITYSSSKEKVVVVDEHGRITALKAGEAVITCKAGDVTDKIYVYVDGVKNITSITENLTIYPGYEYKGSIELKVDSSDFINEKYFSFVYDKDLNIDVWYSKINKKTNTVIIDICNYDTDIEKNETFTVTIKYAYPGGTTFETEVEVTLATYPDLQVSDVDLTKTDLHPEFNIYKTSSTVITKFIYLPIYYISTENRNINNYYFECFGLELNYATYDSLIIDLDEIDLSNESITVKYYPSKEKSEYLEFILNLNIIETTTSYTGFEMNRLYEESENKKNEIFYKYFNKDLFSDVTFNSEVFVDSGLIIELSDETKEYIDLEMSELGFIESIDFKEKNKLGIPSACQLEFYIYSLYEYKINPNCEKYTYIIDIVTDYDKLEVTIDNNHLFVEDAEITIKEDEVLSIEYELYADLEYKGNFQTDIHNSICEIISNDSEIVFIDENSIYAFKPGVTTIEIFVSSKYTSKLVPIILTVTVTDNSGALPLLDEIVIQVESYDELATPNLKNNYIGTNTVLKLSMMIDNNYTFISSDEKVLKIEQDGTAKALSDGKVTIIAKSNQDPSITYSIELTVYNSVSSFEILKGKFKSLERNGTNYIIYAKTNKLYKFKLSDYFDEIPYTFVKNTDSENFELDESGNILIKADGTYYGSIILGDADSPYKYEVSFTVVSSDVGLKDTFLFFIRKAVGHFGLFMVTGIMAFVVLMLFNVYKIKNKWLRLLPLVVFGPLFAYATELIQKLTPTRHYSIDDVKIDTYGYLTGVVLLLVFYLLFIGIKYLINKKKKA